LWESGVVRPAAILVFAGAGPWRAHARTSLAAFRPACGPRLRRPRVVLQQRAADPAPRDGWERRAGNDHELHDRVIVEHDEHDEHHQLDEHDELFQLVDHELVVVHVGFFQYHQQQRRLHADGGLVHDRRRVLRSGLHGRGVRQR
jgi:hypothetical protein